MAQSPYPFFNRDPELNHKIETLLAQMTLAEKVGQMVQSGTYWKQDMAPMVRAGQIGSILSTHDMEGFNRLQRIAVEESRLQIPLILANDVLHGYRTIYPIPLAASCTWDPQLIEQTAAATSREAAAAGTCWNFTPMVDICRDPRWGRIAEGAGEDPYLGSAIAAAQVRGLQTSDLPGRLKMAACVKHFAAYGGAESGKDYNTVDMSERRLRDVYLPPYKAAVEAGVATLMTSFNELNGIPATANTFLLRTILREEWGFQGVIISDYDAIGELVNHGLAGDLREAALLGIRAGVDIDMMSHAYHNHLADLVEEGLVPLAWIDDAVRRILWLKFRLGIFEHPYLDLELPQKHFLSPAHRELALRAAQDSMVLLKNEGGLLPLQPGLETVALIGPLADEKRSLLGSWACLGRAEEAVSLRDGLRQVLPASTNLLSVPGCSLEGSETDFSAALETARQADLVILAVGEPDHLSGEARSRGHLGLPGSQQALAEAVFGTGKPVVMVVFSGRPLTISWLAEHIPAILMAWQGGTMAGLAIANLLTGQAVPSAKLSASFPRSEGQIPVYYAHKNTGRPYDIQGVIQFNREHRSTYIDQPNTPLFPFGFGLSYTRFSYANLKVETPLVATDGMLAVSAEVSNSGLRDGVEIVQCYVRDLVGSVTRPVRELKGFQKLAIPAGQTRTVRFEIPAASLGFYGPSMQYQVEPGDFKVWIGPDSQSGLEGRFSVTA